MTSLEAQFLRVSTCRKTQRNTTSWSRCLSRTSKVDNGAFEPINVRTKSISSTEDADSKHSGILKTNLPHIAGFFESGTDSIGLVNDADSAGPFKDRPLGSSPTTHVSGGSLLSTKKRKRAEGSLGFEEQRNSEDQELEDKLGDDRTTELTDLAPKRQKISRFSEIRLPAFVFPKSQYEGWRPPLPIAQEKDVLSEFVENSSRQSSADGRSNEALPRPEDPPYLSFILTEFSVYLPEKGPHPDELISLHNLESRRGHHGYLFDGVLCHGSLRRYVQRVPFGILSIGNYEDTDQHTVGPSIWLQTACSRRVNVWYQLGQPSPEYERYHQPFLWLADLSKHFVDYLDNHDKVSLRDFKETFFSWINNLHGQDSSFQRWLAEYAGTDFRRAIAANPEFLWNQARDLNQQAFDKHPLSVEVHPNDLNGIKVQTSSEESTLVTPFVYECFKHLSWGQFLKPRRPSLKVSKAKQDKEKGLHETTGLQLDLSENTGDELAIDPKMADQKTTPSKRMPDGEPYEVQNSLAEGRFKKHGASARNDSRLDINVGDVVGVSKDEHTVWKGQAALWFAYVQALRTNIKGQITLDVLWLYAPSDTTCSTGRYPFANELFFSDNCNCEDALLGIKDVIHKASVAFYGRPGDTDAEYIVRQKYTHEETFVTLRDSDFHCVHQSVHNKTDIAELMEKFRVGDSVLTMGVVEDQKLLEPVEIVAFDQSGLSDKVKVRRLLRLNRDFGYSEARPNELVYTDETLTISAHAVDRICHVRFYTTGELRNSEIPAPYNRDGTADAYYITCRQVQSNSLMLEFLRRPFPKTLIQGFDPTSPPPKEVLLGMDLFCGGGNFGRGLEEGGALLNKWAVDWNTTAMHTYKANLRETEDTRLYNGSVNDYLAHAMEGSSAAEIAEVGEVDFISAGSPCQGYSVANMARKTDKALKYCSMVASVAAFIDFYRPKYALLENVTSMAQNREKNSDENVFSQMLCALVAMGYQVGQFHLDAWSFGSAQSRSRLFICVAAPGLHLPTHPALSHSHLSKTTQRSLGKAANGLGFGLRQFGATPFEYVTAAEATCDLPYIGDTRVSTCVRYPDHRTSRTESTRTRVLIARVPRFPYGQTFMTAYLLGRMNKPQIDENVLKDRVRGSAQSRSWGRLKPDGLFPTITTGIRPQDGRSGGTTIHWNEHRLLTIMEARRAQGFPDEEVLVGSTANQWKIIGNSVARTVAMALGMSLRTAWLANKPTTTANTPPHQQRSTSEANPLPPSSDSHPIKQPLRGEVIDISSDTDPEISSSEQILSDLQATIPRHRPASTPQSRLSQCAPRPASTKITNQITRSETRVMRTTTMTRRYTSNHTPSTAQPTTPTRRPRSAIQRLANGYQALYSKDNNGADVLEMGASQQSPIEIDG
ncbi:MAG: DNA methyltransferase Dim-2 [Pleopsidium flavum]|nr:MAG: DNA methyltransferase Dim-2 [Pleopsidium flavum]